jgi:CBS domain-containing protein
LVAWADSRPKERDVSRVRDYMLTEPVVLRPETRLEDALALMTREDVPQLPVAGEDGAFLGVVRHSELCEACVADQRDGGILGLVVVGTPVVHEDDPVATAVDRAAEMPLNCPIPVLRAGRLVGVVRAKELPLGPAGTGPEPPRPSHPPVKPGTVFDVLRQRQRR